MYTSTFRHSFLIYIYIYAYVIMIMRTNGNVILKNETYNTMHI